MKRVFATVDERISPECERSLTLQGFTVIKLPPLPSLSSPIASHTDMLMFYHGDTLISSTYYCDAAPFVFSDIHDLAPKIKLMFADEAQTDKYPHDAIFNALVIGNRLFIKTDTASKAVIEYGKSCGLKIIHTNQGYPACTVLRLSEDTAITADSGMARTLEREGIKVTLISNGSISLPPYEYGFIGGTAGIYDGKIYFLGDPETHPDAQKIIDACTNANLEIRALSGGILSDLGGILFFEE